MKNNEICLFTPIDIFGMSVDERRKYIAKSMKAEYLGKQYFCPSLDCDIYVTANSIKETSSHASKSFESSIAALNLPQIIELAKLERVSLPHSNTQKRTFKAKEVYILRGFLGQRLTAKLVVVKTCKGARLEYCVTAKRAIPELLGTKKRVSTPHSLTSPSKGENSQRSKSVEQI